MVRTIRHTREDGSAYWEVTVGEQTIIVHRLYSSEAGRRLYFPWGARAGFGTLAEVRAWLAAADAEAENKNSGETPAPEDADVQRIQTRSELMRLKAELGVREDWHEPDEQGLNAYVVGDHLDNAMGSGLDHTHGELQVIITKRGYSDDSKPYPYAVINLATLLAWATGYEEQP